ncbi:MAG: hypothetical protein ACOC5M_01060, partial [Chloroflexota bacterium]
PMSKRHHRGTNLARIASRLDAIARECSKLSEEIRRLNTNMEDQPTNHNKEEVDLKELKTRVLDSSKSEAEAVLRSLNRELIRRLASELNVRIGSKATKEEAVKELLWNVFDAPAGHDIVRNRGKDNT